MNDFFELSLCGTLDDSNGIVSAEETGENSNEASLDYSGAVGSTENENAHDAGARATHYSASAALQLV